MLISVLFVFYCKKLYFSERIYSNLQTCQTVEGGGAMAGTLVSNEYTTIFNF